MYKEERNEMKYQLALYVAKKLFKEQYITLKELEKMHCILVRQYRPYIGKLFSLKDLIS